MVENLNTEKLSARLETVARFVPNQSKLADIGSDHAYLPCYLAKKGVVTFAIAGEVVEGPYKSACRQVTAEGLSGVIAVRLGDGLEVLHKEDHIDCITIAGMGGALITSILENGKKKLETVKRLILQPNIGAKSIRTWFLENNWELIDEEILEEDGKIYEVLIAEKGEPLHPYSTELEKEILIGPYLMQKKGNAFQKKWRLEMENWQRIYMQLEKAEPTVDIKLKKQELLQTMKQVEEALK